MCVLSVSGRDFNPSCADALGPSHVSRAGEPLRRSRPDGPRRKESEVRVIVSEAPLSDLEAQANDACAFLDRHAETIRVLRESGTVEDMRLDFPVGLRITENVLGQVEFLPPRLVERAGALGLGLEISIYPVSEEEEGASDDAG